MSECDVNPRQDDAALRPLRLRSAIGLLLASWVILFGLPRFAYGFAEEPVGFWWPYIYSIAVSVMMYFLGMRILRRNNPHLGTLGEAPRAGLMSEIVVASIVGISLVATLMLLEWLFGFEYEYTYFDRIVESRNMALLLLVSIHAILLAPFVEEVLFRGILFRSLNGKIPVFWAALIAAVVFACAHPYGWLGNTIVCVYGLVFAAMYQWRKTLVSPILTHLVVNMAISLYAMLWMIFAPTDPYLGVSFDSTHKTIQVEYVVPYSGAEDAGLEPGDVILKVDGSLLSSPDNDLDQYRFNLHEAMNRAGVGQTVHLTVLRNDDEKTVQALLGSRQHLHWNWP
jgi:membrane protease YdiL (CAAX protease family)